MKSSIASVFTLSLSLFGLVGCPADGGNDPDAGGTVDGGRGAVDSGTRMDAGTATVDAGNTVVDAGGATPDAGWGDPFPNGLQCTTHSLCSTYEADPSRVPFPDYVGGELQDGLYRAVQGTNLPYALAFHDGKFATIFENLTVASGTFETSGDSLTMNQDAVCSSNGVVDDAAVQLMIQSFYATDGTELLTYSGCDSVDPDNCASPTRLLRVSSLCDDLDDLSCPGGDCNCFAFEDDIPVRPADGSCSF